jgi:CHAD domain-containing protein
MSREPARSQSAGADLLATVLTTGRTPRERIYALGRGASQRTLVALLREEAVLRALPRQSLELTYYETFDWRLHRHGLRLFTQEDAGETVLALRPLTDGAGQVLRLHKIPSFAADLPAGPLRARLEAVTDVRRILPVVRVEARSRGYAVLDDEQKTVVRLFFEHARARDPAALEQSVALARTLRVVLVAGYRKECAAVLSRLGGRPGVSVVSGDLAERALAALGRAPQERSGGLRCALDPDAPIGAAFLVLHGELFAAMRANERGIRQDLDTEHLHDFRVALRRTRLLHRIFRDELAGTALDTLAPGFKWLRKVSNPTRDLDVHLLELRRQAQALPGEADALLPLETLLRERRREEWKKLVTALESVDYAELEVATAALLDPPPTEAAARIAKTGPPLGPWASLHLAKAWRRLRKHAKRIDHDSPDARLHELRLDGKRLRYLLEFFRSLYPSGEVDPLVKELKRLQDNLGAFNDACVQSRVLRALARDLTAGGTNGEALLAIGRLVERAEQRRARERARFHKRFERFDARSNRAWFRRLSGSVEGQRSEEPAATANEGHG